MNNYFRNYANYFIGIGSVLLLMYFLDIVPWRFREAPDVVRWLLPVVFIVAGIYGKRLPEDN